MATRKGIMTWFAMAGLNTLRSENFELRAEESSSLGRDAVEKSVISSEQSCEAESNGVVLLWLYQLVHGRCGRVL